MASKPKRSVKKEPDKADSAKVRQRKVAVSRPAKSDADTLDVDEPEALPGPAEGPNVPEALVYREPAGEQAHTTTSANQDMAFDRPAPSRKRLGAFLFLIPIFLLLLFATTSFFGTTDDAGIAFTAVEAPSLPEIQIAAETEANAVNQPQVPEQNRGATDAMRSELDTVRKELQQTRAQAAAAQVAIEQQRQIVARERQTSSALRAVINRIEAGTSDQRAPNAKAANDLSDAMRSELDTVRKELEQASAQAGAAQAAIEQQRQIVARERETSSALRAVINRIEAEASGQRALNVKAANDLSDAQQELQRLTVQGNAELEAMETELAAKTQALELERDGAALATRDLAAARQSIEQYKADAQLALKKQVELIHRAVLSGVGAKRADDARARERQQATALVQSLVAARLEQVMTRLAVDREREKAGALIRDLASARNDLASAREAVAVADAAGRRPKPRRSEPKVQLPTVITLPDALLPTRPLQ